jgi:hypothetical protein
MYAGYMNGRAPKALEGPNAPQERARAEEIYREKVIPLARNFEGLLGLIFCTNIEGEGVSISLWASEEDASRGGLTRLQDEGMAQFSDFFKVAIQQSGPVVAFEEKAASGFKAARITLMVPRQGADRELVAFYRETMIPGIRELPGFAATYVVNTRPTKPGPSPVAAPCSAALTFYDTGDPLTRQADIALYREHVAKLRTYGVSEPTSKVFDSVIRFF